MSADYSGIFVDALTNPSLRLESLPSAPAACDTRMVGPAPCASDDGTLTAVTAEFTCTHCNAVPEQVVDGNAKVSIVRHELGCPTLMAQTRELRQRTVHIAGRAGHRLLFVLGELMQTTTGKWITHPPTRCPNGHTLGPGAVLVGYEACLGHGGGHTTWTCRTCDQTVYGPPLNTHCTERDGPATVRISSLR